MGKITKNPNGTYSMNGFSNKNPEDMNALAKQFAPFKKPNKSQMSGKSKKKGL